MEKRKNSKKDPIESILGIDAIFATITAIASSLVLFIIAGILFTLISQSWLSIKSFGIFGFIFSTEWDPVKKIFGAAASIYGTLITTGFAMLIAVPSAIGIAIFVTEIAPNKLKGIIGSAIELLAAIPSIIFGMWGLFTLAPIMSDYIEPAIAATLGRIPIIGAVFSGATLGIDLFTASIILSIMILPFTASVSRDAFNLTPSIVKESAYAMGATQWEVIRDVVIPFSKRGVFGGIILSLGRALGETMAVAFVLGNNHQITASLFNAAATITVTLANEFTEANSDIYLSSLFYLALILFVMSFVILAIAKYFLVKSRHE
ncbi:MAG: phosphate ABC transporter permease subunit PstC [Nitrospirae bacterium]|nr:phosphate ABC transporter permease subunit PstC [Nitrospirota bacterium]